VFAGVDDPVGDGFVTNSPAPLTIKTQGYAFWGPDRFEKPNHARAPAIPTRTCEPRGQSALGVKQQTTKAQDRNKTVQIGVVFRFLGSNSDYSARSKTGTGQHVEDDDEVRVDPEDH
jgi:hypothetical protein